MHFHEKLFLLGSLPNNRLDLESVGGQGEKKNKKKNQYKDS